MPDPLVTLEERFQPYPQLKKSVETLLALVEEPVSARKTADEAELRVIEELRSLGHALLQAWAVTQETVHGEAFREHHATMVGHGKKNSIGTPPLEKLRWLNGCTGMIGIWCVPFQRLLA